MTFAATPTVPRAFRAAIAARAAAWLAAFLGLGLPCDCASARGRDAGREEYVQSRQAGVPVMAIISLSRQRVTIYDAEGWIMRAPVSSGRTGYETPAGVYSILQRKAEHYSNLYDDAAMPFMQRLTWSGIALHGGDLPGYPASHGCVRMPHEFAERLFGVSRLGMRVIVMRDDIAPADISHPVLFRPSSGSVSAEANGGPHTVALEGTAGPYPTSTDLRKVAAEKAAEAQAAADRLARAGRAAAAKYKESAMAQRTVRMARSAKFRAEAYLRRIERQLTAATELGDVDAAMDVRARAQAALVAAQAKFEAIEAEVQPVLDAAAQVREVALAARKAKLAAEEDAREAKRKIAPISVFISRATQRLYVRQAFEPLFESPVTIADPDDELGTYVLTALAYANDETDLRWNAVAVKGESRDVRLGRARERRNRGGSSAAVTDTAAAKAALDRISIPPEALARISAIVSPGSALIVSDEALHKETGPATDFVIVMSGEPQGGIAIRSRAREAGHRLSPFLRRELYGWGRSYR